MCRLGQRFAVLVLAMLWLPATTSFLLLPTSHSSSVVLQMANKPTLKADFEFQELKIQLNAMKEQNVVSSQLALPKKTELEGYVKGILNQRAASAIPLDDIADYLPESKWRLAFTTQSLTSELPKDAKIVLEFLDNDTLNYRLEFTKTLGLKRLVAKSSYTVDSSPVNPGLVTFVYDSVTTDIFGLSNVNIGFFGLLQGRSNYINTRYFDDNLWIETGVEAANGMEFCNVYMKEGESGEW